MAERYDGPTGGLWSLLTLVVLTRRVLYGNHGTPKFIGSRFNIERRRVTKRKATNMMLLEQLRKHTGPPDTTSTGKRSGLLRST